MDKFRKENSFLVLLSVCVLILLVICGVSFNFSVRGTRAYFPGGTTGTLGGTIYKVIYYSNWPNEMLEDENIEDQKKNIYMIMDNMFIVPDGYEFVGWVDVNGIEYKSSDVIKLTADLELYAVWNMIVEDTSIEYGDVNQNGEIDEEDYLIIEDYISGIDNMDDKALLNADVNVDGKIDLVDVDIIKQVYLGNNLYIGKLPVEPILIYDIYEGSVDVGNNGSASGEGNDSESDGGDGDESSSSGSETGTGSGNSGSGTGSSGQGTSNNSGNTSTGGNLSSGNANGENLGNDNNSSSNNNNEEDVLKEKRYFYFRFMNGNLEHMTTRCDVLDDSSCDLVLPNNPEKDGYTFSGWSIDKNCSNGSIIKNVIKVDSDNTYYACFILENVEDDNSNIYVIIMVVGICLIAGRMIWYLVKRYRDENTDFVE